MILTSNEFSNYAATFTWTYAKTMPQCPHEYIVKGKTAVTDAYEAMFYTIGELGDWGDWKGTPQQYYRPGDGYYYWRMTGDINESVIINRAKEEAYDKVREK